MSRTLALTSVFLVALCAHAVHAATPRMGPLSLFSPLWSSMQKAVKADTDKDGLISGYEFAAFLKAPDANNDGNVSRCEFTKYWTENSSDEKEALNLSFDSYDLDGDDTISNADILLFNPNLIDTNNDQRLSVSELRVYLMTESLNSIRRNKCQPFYLYALPPKEIKQALSRCP